MASEMVSFSGGCAGGVVEPDGKVVPSVGPVVGTGDGTEGAWVVPVVGFDASVELVGSVGAVDSLGGRGWKQPLNRIASIKSITVIRFIPFLSPVNSVESSGILSNYTQWTPKLQEQTTHLSGKMGGKY